MTAYRATVSDIISHVAEYAILYCSFSKHSLLLVGARSSVCLPYWWVDDPQCVSAHPPCSSVELYGNLTLEESESLLRTLFSDMNSAVENGRITPPCGRVFPLLYCHQVYTRCSSTPATNSSGEDAVSLCEGDCSEAMSECRQDWRFLTDLVDSTPDLPPLPANCSTMLELGECISITAGT